MPLARKLLAAAAAATLLACALSPADAETIAGRARVIDGETLEVRGTRIKLFAVEADHDHVCERTDELRWRCGPRAATALDELLVEAIVSCAVRERDGEGKTTAVCTVGPVDLSLWLIRNGLAVATSSTSGKYRQAEDEARAARRGIWSEKGR